MKCIRVEADDFAKAYAQACNLAAHPLISKVRVMFKERKHWAYALAEDSFVVVEPLQEAEQNIFAK